MLNPGLNPEFFLSLCVYAYVNFIFEFWSSFSAAQNGRLCQAKRHKNMIFIWIVWRTLCCLYVCLWIEYKNWIKYQSFQNCIFIRTLWFFLCVERSHKSGQFLMLIITFGCILFWLEYEVKKIGWAFTVPPYYLILWPSRKLATNSQNDDWCQLAPKENLRGCYENWISERISSFILGLTN